MNPALQYINTSPEPLRSILIHIQHVIEATIPEAQLKFEMGLPFYYLDEDIMFCFLHAKNHAVEVVMPEGKAVVEIDEVWATGEMVNAIRSLRYDSLQEINDKILMKELLELRKRRLAH